jgi:hypothetical protein
MWYKTAFNSTRLSSMRPQPLRCAVLSRDTCAGADVWCPEALLHGFVGIGVFGLVSKAAKWDESAKWFDGTSIGMFDPALSLCASRPSRRSGVHLCYWDICCRYYTGIADDSGTRQGR